MGVSLAPDVPTRLVARQVSELLFRRGRRWAAIVPHGRTTALVFDIVLSAGIAHLPNRDGASGRWFGIEEAPERGRPVSGLAIAQSMALPPTTVRRRAAALVEAGLLRRARAGFLVEPRVFANGTPARLAVEGSADLARVLRDLAATGYGPARRAIEAGLGAVPPDVVERLFLGFGLRTMETFVERFEDLTAATLVSAIIAANIRHVTQDAMLARFYAGEEAVPPDELRRPITLRALSQEAGVPFETVRRRIDALVEKDLVVRTADGVVVPTSVLQSEPILQNNRRILLFFEQMTNTLAALATADDRPGTARRYGMSSEASP